MTQLRPFPCYGRYGVVELNHNRPIGFFSPSFPDLEHAALFIAWLENWHQMVGFWPPEQLQMECAERIAEYLADIDGTPVENVMSAAEVAQDFVARYGRTVGSVAAA